MFLNRQFAGGKIIQKISFMPIFFQQDIDADTKLGVWKIEEDESFFLRMVMPQRNVSHPHKKLQHLAGRYLLKYLFADFPVSLIQIADTRKPFLENEAYHFSISHCSDYAAAIVSKSNRVGVDVELITSKVERIQHKFLTEEEWQAVKEDWNGLETQLNFKTNDSLLTLLWSCKESVFKWYGLGEVDFRDHIQAQSIFSTKNFFYHSVINFKKEHPVLLNLWSHFFDRLCLSYVVTKA